MPQAYEVASFDGVLAAVRSADPGGRLPQETIAKIAEKATLSVFLAPVASYEKQFKIAYDYAIAAINGGSAS